MRERETRSGQFALTFYIAEQSKSRQSYSSGVVLCRSRRNFQIKYNHNEIKQLVAFGEYNLVAFGEYNIIAK